MGSPEANAEASPEIATKAVLADLSSRAQPKRTSADPISGDPDKSDIEQEHRSRTFNQTHRLRYYVSAFVGVLLIVELVALFLIVIAQGLEILKLNEWAFTTLTNGVLLQTFFSFRTIVTHLFPDGAKDFQK